MKPHDVTPPAMLSPSGVPSMPRAAIVAIAMGYGHQRPARALATQLGCEVLHADRPPLADQEEQERWAKIRTFYENMSRVSGLPLVGTPFRLTLNAITAIPHLHPFRDQSAPTIAVSFLERSARQGLGRSMIAYLEDHDLPLVTTFYSPAVLADYHGYDRIFCVVTDSDVNRVWAPMAPRSSKIRYFAPSGRVVRRLRAYGVDPRSIELTGFPLPHSLVGGPDAPVLRRNLAARLGRLDPNHVFRRQFASDLESFDSLSDDGAPPHLVFAVGGAGAQVELPGQFLPSLRDLLVGDRLRLTLVAGVRADVRDQFLREIDRAHLTAELDRRISILFAPQSDEYFDRFDAVLSTADVLWTKPSELVFYAALGIPLLLSSPIGVHEEYNRRFARESGVAFIQRNPRTIGDRLIELLEEGHLAAAAWAGYRRLPHSGLYRILARLSAAG